MAKVDKWISCRKGITRGLQYAAVTIAALQTVPVPEGIGVSKQITVSFVIGVLGAVAKGIHNYRKISAKPMRYSGYGLLLAALSLAVCGCVTTTAPDGTIVQTLDTQAMTRAYEIFAKERPRTHVDSTPDDQGNVLVNIDGTFWPAEEVKAELERRGVKLPVL